MILNGTAAGRSVLPDNTAEAWIYVTIEFLIALVAVLGNVLVIFVFAQNKSGGIRSYRNYYIVGLAAADLLFGLVGIPASVIASLGLVSMGLYGCLATCSVLMMTVGFSTLCLLGVSVDRFWATYSPLGYYKSMDEGRASAILAFCAALGSFIGLLPLFGWYNHDWEPEEHSGCRFRLLMDYNYLTFLYFAGVLLPATLIAGFYAYIFHVIRARRAQASVLGRRRAMTRTQTSTSSSSVEKSRGKEAKAGQKLLSLIVMYLVCWLPINTINCLQNFCPTCPVPIPLLQAAILVSHANAAINPFLYAYHLKKFRIGMKNAILQCSGLGFGGVDAES